MEIELISNTKILTCKTFAIVITGNSTRQRMRRVPMKKLKIKCLTTILSNLHYNAHITSLYLPLNFRPVCLPFLRLSLAFSSSPVYSFCYWHFHITFSSTFNEVLRIKLSKIPLNLNKIDRRRRTFLTEKRHIEKRKIDSSDWPAATLAVFVSQHYGYSYR